MTRWTALGLAAVLAAPPALADVPAPDELAAFKAAPVGQRLAALAHEPLLALRLGPDQVAMAVYVPVQGALSRWDDESRIVLYRRGAADYERMQFVSKAGESVPGRLQSLEARDLDGDGVAELLAVGRAHGPVGKATIMVFRREAADAKFAVVFRRRQIAPAVTFEQGGKLTYTYEARVGERRWEAFGLDGGMYVPADGQAVPIVLD